MVVASHNAAHLFIRAVQSAAAARAAHDRHCWCRLPTLRHRLVFCLIFLLHFGRKFFQLREKLSQFRFGKLQRNTVQPHKPFAVLVPNRHVLDAGTVLDLIAHLLQPADKIVKVGAFDKRHFHISFDHTAQCRLALAAAAPLAIRDTASVRFYDRQPVLPAQVIGNLPYALIVGFEIVAEHFAVHKGNRIDHNMVMQMPLVQMGGHRTLKPIRQTASG